METGLVVAPQPQATARIARRVEELGFSTLLLTDSQNLAPEVYTQLAVAALATERLRIGTGVSNSVTRDSAVVASAALALQAESRGRMVLGIGRGDSAVQRIGRDAHSLAGFERYVREVQRYLRGDSVERHGFESRLEWHRAVREPKVPVCVAATGPRVIEIAARHADAVIFAIGADGEHLSRALERARAAAREAGRSPEDLRFGAFVNVALHPDLAVARDAVRGAAATFARFSSFKGSPLAQLPEPLRQMASLLRESYDMRHHTRQSSVHARALEDSFVDWFALAGPPERVLPRFDALAKLGLDALYLVSASSDTPREIRRTSLELISREVLPILHAR